jgi:DNA phosphorothioation-dependent restriction protein DptH
LRDIPYLLDLSGRYVQRKLPKSLKILVPPRKLEIRKEQYEGLEVEPLLFRPQELGAPEWSLLLGAGGEQLYLKKIKNILEKLKNEDRLTVEHLKTEIQTSELNKNQKELSILRVGFVEKFLNENAKPLEEYLASGSITLLDIRDDMLDEQDASILLGMLLISMGKIERDKILVIDEAHKYFGKTLAKDIVELIREMRHTRTRILIASQDPPSVNAKVIELSDVVLLHRMNSPEWLKHIQGKNIALKRLKSEDLSSLKSGEVYIWASKSTEQEITKQPMKIEVRPRLTEHGGATKTAV